MMDDKIVKESTEYENFVDKKVSKEKQSNLSEFLGVEDDIENEIEPWKKHWVGMPEYVQESNEAYMKINIRFRNKEDYDEFSEIINQHLTNKTKSIWYPKLDKSVNKLMRWIEED